MDYFQLMRNFWDFAFENPEKINTNHCAMYSFAVEHCNRLGWKRKFGFPSSMVMDAIGIKSYNTYSNTINDLIGFGFFELIEKSKNQYSSNIIALSNFDKALTKALDKAFIKHSLKQVESNSESIDSIDKQYTNIPVYNKTINHLKEKNEIFISELMESQQWIEVVCAQNKITVPQLKKWLYVFDAKLKSELDVKNSKKDFTSHFSRWLPGEMMKQKKLLAEDLITDQKKEKIGGF